MKKAFEEKFLSMVVFDTRKIFTSDNSITENYYDAWCYVSKVIDTVADNASQYLLSELYSLRDEYQTAYLFNKGLI